MIDFNKTLDKLMGIEELDEVARKVNDTLNKEAKERHRRYSDLTEIIAGIKESIILANEFIDGISKDENLQYLLLNELADMRFIFKNCFTRFRKVEREFDFILDYTDQGDISVGSNSFITYKFDSIQNEIEFCCSNLEYVYAIVESKYSEDVKALETNKNKGE